MDLTRTLLRALPRLLCAAASAAGAALAGVADAARAAATTTTVTAAAGSGAPTGNVLYGLGDGEGQFARCADSTAACCYGDPASCPPGTITGYWNNPWFQDLASPRSTHRLSYVRLFVSIDAVAQFNGSLTHPAC